MGRSGVGERLDTLSSAAGQVPLGPHFRGLPLDRGAGGSLCGDGRGGREPRPLSSPRGRRGLGQQSLSRGTGRPGSSGVPAPLEAPSPARVGKSRPEPFLPQAPPTRPAPDCGRTYPCPESGASRTPSPRRGGPRTCRPVPTHRAVLTGRLGFLFPLPCNFMLTPGTQLGQRPVSEQWYRRWELWIWPRVLNLSVN